MQGNVSRIFTCKAQIVFLLEQTTKSKNYNRDSMSAMHTFTCACVVCVRVNIPLIVCNDQLGLFDHELCVVLPMSSIFVFFVIKIHDSQLST